jgi:hypothetical protein
MKKVKLYPKHSTNDPMQLMKSGRKNMQGWFFLSCWHLNEGESAAMWKLYTVDGIAIQSTVGRLMRSFDKTPEDIHISEVSYYSKTPPHSLMDAFTKKRLSFKHEQELRAIHVAITGTRLNRLPGIPIAVDLNTLIQGIYVAPKCHTYIKDALEAVIERFADKYKAIGPIHQSELYKDPLV